MHSLIRFFFIPHPVIPYFVASCTVLSCIQLPLITLYVATDETGITFKRLITDPTVRGPMREALTSTILAEVTFTSIATLAGTAAGAIWWLINGSHSHNNPIPVALAGGGIGLIASISLTVPLLWIRALPVKLPSAYYEQTRRGVQWILHGPELRSRRWCILGTMYLLVLCSYVSVALFWSMFFYNLHHRHANQLLSRVWEAGTAYAVVALLALAAGRILMKNTGAAMRKLRAQEYLRKLRGGTQTLAGSPRNERGDGQVSHLLLAEGQFGAQRLCVTWVECQPGSKQGLHRHLTQEQVYVIVRGYGQMLVGDEERAVGEGTMVFMPPGTPHAIRNTGSELLVYVSATSPPFTAKISGQTWEPQRETDHQG